MEDKKLVKPKIIRTSTIAMSLNILLKGQLQFLSKKQEVIGVSSAGDGLNEVSTREGVRTIAVEMERGISPLKDFVSLVRMFLLFRKEKPLLVHSITPKAGLITMLAGKLAGVPIRIHTFTGLIFPYRTGLLQKILIAMDRLLCWSATTIFPEGEGVKKDLQKFKITSKPLQIIANGNVNGIDTSFYDKHLIPHEERARIREKLGIKSSDFVYVFVGRLVSDKGINELISAFEQIKDTSVHLILVGPYENEDPLKEQTVHTINQSKTIHAVGFQKDVRTYFSIANALVFPSYREGFPNVVLQAGAMSLPCIVTDISGSNEIISHNENGIIVPVKNQEALHLAMKTLIEDKELYNKLQSRSRMMIQSRFEQHMVWQAIQEQYDRLLNTIKK